MTDFERHFQRLMSFPPLRWQCRFYERILSGAGVPQALDLPTGLGKTAVMVIWYLAWKAGAALPRRLVYVVDRRAVVDQATTIAEAIQKNAADDRLVISTLRGQHADNRKWLKDPSSPAIIVGTVDMIGSRLLFSGYGVSRKMRPYHSGLLGVDTLFVLDEAHLCGPFEALLRTIADDRQARFKPAERPVIPPTRFLALSATGRHSDEVRDIFSLTPDDKEDRIVAQRLSASKTLFLEVLPDTKDLVSSLAQEAFRLGTSGDRARILIYCNSRDDAESVRGQLDRLCKGDKTARSQLLVGARRVREREQLASWLGHNGFLAGSERASPGPAYLVATSAGEVGIDLDADHMVCDLVTWERMVQRLGRVNRRGERRADIRVFAAPFNKEKSEDWLPRLARLRAPFDHLPPKGEGWDASPGAILALKEVPEASSTLNEATSPAPLYPALSRALVDAWSMTSLKDHAGRPDIQPWLRGWEPSAEPQTEVVWRRYLPVRAQGAQPSAPEIEAFFEAAPPHLTEKLETETRRVRDWLSARVEKLTKTKGIKGADALGVLGFALSPDGSLVRPITGAEMERYNNGREPDKKEVREAIEKALRGATLVVTAGLGGLTDGMLDKAADEPPLTADGENSWLADDEDPLLGFRVRQTEAPTSPRDLGTPWRERYRFGLKVNEEGEASQWLVVEKWRDAAATEDDRATALRAQLLGDHQRQTKDKMGALGHRLNLPPWLVHCLELGAVSHDEGKRHPLWQRAFNAPHDGQIYGKTRGPARPALLGGYRHEFGSLPFVETDPEVGTLPADQRDLVLHVVAAHHGFARPFIAIDGCDAGPPSQMRQRAIEVALRFARLQCIWGPWGLAWIEALLRAADAEASADNDRSAEEKAEVVHG